jgi:hypothetical protein
VIATSHLSTRDRHPVLDEPSQWTAAEARPFFDADSYQRRIDDLLGRTRDGKSIIALRWAPEVWNPAMPDVKRYWTTRERNGDTGEWLYTSPPRWVFEKRLEPEQYLDAWNRTRYSTTEPEEGDPVCGRCGEACEPLSVEGRVVCPRCFARDSFHIGRSVDKGPPPEEYYTFAYLIAEHDPEEEGAEWPPCCERLYRETKARCWGYYRQPGDFDLELIAQAKRRMDDEEYVDPYAPLSLPQLLELERAAGEQVERVEAEAEVEAVAVQEDFNRQHAWRLSETDAGVLQRGSRLHFLGENAPGFKQTESGIYVPED